jgi:putative PEP-CTERM system TPR-repeat lipoprotein
MKSITAFHGPLRAASFGVLVLGVLAGGGYSSVQASAVSAQKSHVSNYEAALASVAKGENQTAVILLKNELQANPDNVAAHLLLGKIYLDEQQGLAAEREFHTARQHGADADLVTGLLGEAYLIENAPQRLLDEVLPGYRNAEAEAKIQVLRGRAFVRLDQSINAEEAFTKAASLNPKSVDPLIGLARLRAEQNRYRDGQVLVGRALAIDSQSFDAEIAKGDIERLTGDLSAALASYNAALGLNPKNVSVRMSRASIYLDQGNYDAARKDIDAVLGVSPSNPYGRYMLSVVLAAKGDKEGAKAALADAAAVLKSISADQPSTQRDLVMLAGLVAFQRGNLEEANKYLTLYISLSSHDVAARRLLASTQIQMKNNSDAVDNLRNVLVGLPNDVPTLNLLGQAYLGMGDTAHAIDTFKQSESLQPKRADTHFMLAKAYQAKGDNEAALPEYASAAGLDPRLRAARIQLVSLNLQLGHAADALKFAQALLIDFPGDPECYNLAALAFQQNKRTDDAKKYFVLAIEKNPAFIPAYLNLAELHRQAREYPLAAGRYQEVLKRDSKNQSALIGLGRLAEAQKNFKDANLWYDRARLVGPGNPAPWSSLISLRMQARDYVGAITLGQDYVSKYPDNYEVKKALGLAYVKAGKLAEASRTYEAVVQVAPDRAKALYELAVVRQMAGNSDGARQSLLNAIAWNGKYAEAYIALIQLEIKAGNLKNVATLGKQLREISPKLADAALGQGYLATQHYDLAEQSYRTGLAHDPNDWNMTAGLYQALLKGAKAPQGLELMERWRKVHPKDEAAELALASGYLGIGLPQKAIPLYEKLIVSQPNNPAFLNDLAWAYHLVKDERGQKLAERAYKLAPQLAVIADTYAWILVQDGQAARALPLLRQAQARDAENPAITYHLASALEALGRQQEARTELAKAFKMSGNFAEANEARTMMKRLASQ